MGDARGLARRGIDDRTGIGTALLAAPIWIDDNDIPRVLADGIETQRRFEAAAVAGDAALVRLLAARLLADWQFLRKAQERSPRAPDGALLAPTLASMMGDGAFVPWASSRPKDISQVPPFDPANVRQWIEADDGTRPQLVRTADPKPVRLDPKRLEEALHKAADKLDIRLASLPAVPMPVSTTPAIDRIVASLSSLTLADISEQTRVPFPGVDRSSPLIERVELILFHGASFSVVLDKSGEPTNLGGRLPYPILVGEPKSPVTRRVPSPGAYVSVQKYGFSTFKIERRAVSKVLFGGVGAFDDKVLNASAPHEVHTVIQTYMDRSSRQYIAGTSLRSAFEPGELTVELIWDRLPDLAVQCVPYAVAEIRKYLSQQGLEQLLKEVAESLVQQIIVEFIKTRIRNFIVKTIGGKLVPFVNLALALYDFFGNEDEFRRIRHAIAAVLLSLRGRTLDEDTIAAKILGEIVAEEFRQDVVAAVVGRLHQHIAARGHDAAAAPDPHPTAPKSAPTPVLVSHAKPVAAPQHVHPEPVRVTPAAVQHLAGLVAGAKGGDNRPLVPATHPAEIPAAAHPTGTPTAARATDVPATSHPPANEPVAHPSPIGEREHPAPPSSAEVAHAHATDDSHTHAPMTEATGTEDRGIMQIGVFDRDPTPLKTRGRLKQDVPETGTPMGFQTQIGTEVQTAIGAPGHLVPVKSRNPDVLVGAARPRHRRDVLKILAADENHPLRTLYDPDTGKFRAPPYADGDMAQWQLHPYDWQAGHGRSHNAGGADVLILQTRYRNQEQNARFEHTGSITKDEAFVVGGIAVDKMSAWDLFHAGHLKLPEGQLPSDLPTLKL